VEKPCLLYVTIRAQTGLDTKAAKAAGRSKGRPQCVLSPGRGCLLAACILLAGYLLGVLFDPGDSGSAFPRNVAELPD
jgi:hypothetical protein